MTRTRSKTYQGCLKGKLEALSSGTLQLRGCRDGDVDTYQR